MVRLKYIFIIILLLTYSSNIYSQIEITGVVIAKDDNSPIPGVQVVEMGTKNGTLTALDGSFSLKVTDLNSTLEFSFIGMVTQEYSLRGEDSVAIKMKTDCNIDTFDHQTIGLFIVSGVLNNPVGGQFDFSFPAFFRATTLKTSLRFQTDLQANRFINSQIELDHIILNCDFQMDLEWNYRNVSYSNFNSKAYSFETNLVLFDIYNMSIYDIGIIVGYSNLSYEKVLENTTQRSSGLLVGLGAYIGTPLSLTLQGKVSFYYNLTEYQGVISGGYKGFSAFLKYYYLESFNELSIGIGYKFGYGYKKWKG